MNPSELIKYLSPKGYIDTNIMYSSKEPHVLDIYNAYNAGVAPEILDKVNDYSFIELGELENDYSLIKTISHPGQIVGGYALSKELADTLQSYFGREALIESGRPVAYNNFYTKEELLRPDFINMGLFRSKRHRLYLYTAKLVGTNKDNKRTLATAEKAYNLQLTSKKESVNMAKSILNEFVSGSILITYDNILSLDSFTIMAKMVAKEIHEGRAIELTSYPSLNTEYRKHMYINGEIPSNYCHDTGKAFRSLFKIYLNSIDTPDTWNKVDDTMYSLYKDNKLVGTIISKSNEEILNDMNKIISRINNKYNTNIKPMILSTIGDFFFPTLAVVHC